jgi:CheY-like chemotaxis protein/Tfp pilus assembly protein PilF
MASGETKEEEKKALGRIALKRRPAAEVLARPSEAKLGAVSLEPKAPGVSLEPRLGAVSLEAKPDSLSLAPALDAAGVRHAELVALSERFGVPALDLLQVCVSTLTLDAIPRALAEAHVLLPVLVRPDRLFLAMKDPSQQEVIREVEFVSGKRVHAYAAKEQEIARVLALAYECKAQGEAYYVGPACPPETLRKAGLLPEPNGEATPVELPPAPEPAPANASEAEAAEPAATAEIAPSGAPPPAAEAQPVEPFERVASLVPPAIVELDDASAEASEAVHAQPEGAQQEPADGAPQGLPDSAPVALPGTVSAYPPRASSLPPALRRHAANEVDESTEAIAEIEDAFVGMTDEPSVVSPLPSDEGVGASARGKTILVVDDSADVRDLLERALRDEGHTVRLADNGRVALQMIKESRPDLVVLDAMLPEVHGFEIARRLRGSQRYRDLPIVIVSAIYRGWRFAEDLRDSCGIEHYVEKPFRLADVKRAVQSALAGSEGSDPDTEEELGECSKLAEQALKEGVKAFQNGETALAISHLEHGVAIDPLAFRLHFHLGLLYAKSGRTFEAISALERAVEINSRHFAGVKNLAIMYYQAGFRHKAAELWERGLNLAPDEATRNAIKEHLVGLLS